MNESVATMLPAEKRSVAIIALVAVGRMFGLFALLPVLAVYAADLDGATPALIGIAVGGYGLTQAILQIPFGAMSDRIGRVPVLLAGLALFAAGSIVAGNSESIAGVIAGRLLQGSGAISATLTALLADSTREVMRTRSMAILGVGIGSSFLLALMLGPAIAAIAGVRAIFYVGAAFAVVAGMLLLLLPARPAVATARAGVSLRGALRPDLLRLDLYVFLLHALLTASFVALPFVLQNELGLPLGQHWKLYVGAILASLLGTVPLILADERKGKDATVAVAIALLAAGFFALAFLPREFAWLLVALAVFFAGFNFLEAGLPARLSIQADPGIRGASLGVFSSSQFLGAFAGGVAGGWLLGTGLTASLFLVFAILTLAWLVVHRLLPGARPAGK